MAAAWPVIAAAGYPAEELALFHHVHDPALANVVRKAIRSSGYVIDSFEAAMWCALNCPTLESVILQAANLGEDTDTIAQIAACLYTAGHLDEWAPRDWRGTLIRTPAAERIISEFAERFGGGLSGEDGMSCA